VFGNLAETYWEDIYKNLNKGICRTCYQEVVGSSKRNLGRLQPIPYVGALFGDRKERLMFIGIESYSSEKRRSEEDWEFDEFKTQQVEDLYFGRKGSGVEYSPFWEWVRVISTKILSPEHLDKKGKLEYAFPRIAYSNLHKCQNWRANQDSSKTTYNLIEMLSTNCIKRARYVYDEIKKINARHVIVFAGTKRSETLGFFLARLFLGYENKSIQTYRYSEPEWQKRNGKDILIKMKDNERRFIVTNHPQGTPTEIRDKIIRIIKENDWEDAEQLNIAENQTVEARKAD